MKLYSTSLFALVLVASVSCSSKEKKTDTASTGPETRTTAGAGEASGDSSEFRTVYFDYDSFKLRGDARAALKTNVEYLKKNPNVAIQIEGHCDERGSNEYNLALGEKRANAAKSFVLKNGIKDNRVSIISYGEERPADSGHDDTAWAKNRRSVFTIVSKNVSQNP